MTVYHPASWAANWPQDARPFASKALAVAHGHAEESLIETSFIGEASQVITEPPAPVQEAQEAEENPSPVDSSAPVVTQAPAGATASTKPTPSSKQFPKKKGTK